LEVEETMFSKVAKETMFFAVELEMILFVVEKEMTDFLEVEETMFSKAVKVTISSKEAKEMIPCVEARETIDYLEVKEMMFSKEVKEMMFFAEEPEMIPSVVAKETTDFSAAKETMSSKEAKATTCSKVGRVTIPLSTTLETEKTPLLVVMAKTRSILPMLVRNNLSAIGNWRIEKVNLLMQKNLSLTVKSTSLLFVGLDPLVVPMEVKLILEVWIRLLLWNQLMRLP
jgi:uncharacterized protein YheU (UPF0270 family)